jgi:glycosyltransferase involved in cell wall biosynthesis
VRIRDGWRVQRSGQWVGNIDDARDGLVVGWLADTSGENRELDVVIYIDGEPWMEAKTAHARPDVPTGVTPGFAAVAHPRGRHHDGPVVVTVLVQSGDSLQEALRAEVPPHRWRRRVLGRLEAYRAGIVTGWMLDLERLDASCQGFIEIDGGLQIPLSTGVSRDDVAQLIGRGAGTRSGFELEVRNVAVSPRVISLFASDEDEPLGVLEIDEVADDDLSEVGDSFATGLEVLRRRRHDANPEFALFRSNRAQLSSSVRARTTVIAAALRPSGLTAFDDMRVLESPATAIYYALVVQRHVHPEDELALVEAGHEQSVARALLVLEALAAHYPGASAEIAIAGCPAAFADALTVPIPSFPAPGITAAQAAFWRLRYPGLDIFTEAGCAELFARWITTMRPLANTARLVTSEQQQWLTEAPRRSEKLAAGNISRYVLGRTRIVDSWTSFDLDDAVEATALLCDVAVDELSNGSGWHWIGDWLRARLLRAEVNRPLGALLQLVWLANRCPLERPFDLEARRSLPLDAKVAAAWFAELPSLHPLKSSDAAGVARASTSDGVAVTVMGLIGHPSGVGTNADNSLAALASSGIAVGSRPLDFSAGRVGRELLSSPTGLAETVLLHAQPEYVPSIVMQGGELFADVRRLIGFFAWELTLIPPGLRAGCRLVDEVWTPSTFCAEAFRGVTDKPVHVVPHAVADLVHDADRTRVRSQLRIPADAHVVLAMFDAHSLVTRKNPLGALRAFQLAFPGDDSAAFVLKVRNMKHLRERARGGSVDARHLLAAIAGDHRVLVVTEELPREDVLSLLSAIDTYISLHRSEGFGYTLIESMALSVPTVATAYSGNLDFMTNDNSWLVPADLVPVDPDDFLHWQAGMEWAEPDAAAAAAALVNIRSDRDERRRRVTNGAKHVAAAHSLTAMAARYASLLSGP